MKFKVFILFVCALFTAHFAQPIYADDPVNDLQNKINQYSQKIAELSQAKDSLANQIKILDSQVDLATLKITQTEKSIANLEVEISKLSDKIYELDVYLNHISTLFLHQIQESYKLNRRLPSYAIFTQSNFSDLYSQFKYLKTLQKINQDNLISMETARTNFDLQKQEKTQKQQELSDLQKSLDDQKNSLLKQKQTKDKLLEITKNDEKKYENLKKEAENELSSLLAAKFVGKKNVKKGDVIGMMGNTGYSFGAHLHFGLYDLKESDLSKWTYANDADPFDFLNSHIWPMDDYTITQGRGKTQYFYLYSDHFHHGVDLVSSNKAVHAVEDGVAYSYRNSQSPLGNHIKLFHPDGHMTLYLHLQ